MPGASVMPDDHSEVVPLLPIPNRTVKRLRADDSAGSRVKVGHRQALTAQKSPTRNGWAFCLYISESSIYVSLSNSSEWKVDARTQERIKKLP